MTEKLRLSAFLDEATVEEGSKPLGEQLRAGQVAGLKWWTPRFISYGNGMVNFSAIRDDSLVRGIAKQSQDAGFEIGCLGTGIGKSKLDDFGGGNKAPYKPGRQVMEDVDLAINNAKIAGAQFLRGFSFYYNPTVGKEEGDFYHAKDLIAEICKKCDENGLIYLIEPEPGLVCNDADSMIRMVRSVEESDGSGHPIPLLVSDLANFHIQGLNSYYEHRKIVESGFLGLIHVKDYTVRCPKPVSPSDEGTLSNFGSIDDGITGYSHVFMDLRGDGLEKVNGKLERHMHLNVFDGLPSNANFDGLIVDIEGHMKGGGQFGGWSGPDGFGVAIRAVTQMFDRLGIPYDIRADEDIVKKYSIHIE